VKYTGKFLLRNGPVKPNIQQSVGKSVETIKMPKQYPAGRLDQCLSLGIVTQDTKLNNDQMTLRTLGCDKNAGVFINSPHGWFRRAETEVKTVNTPAPFMIFTLADLTVIGVEIMFNANGNEYLRVILTDFAGANVVNDHIANNKIRFYSGRYNLALLRVIWDTSTVLRC
jgi:hypothetical protein